MGIVVDGIQSFFGANLPGFKGFGRKFASPLDQDLKTEWLRFPVKVSSFSGVPGSKWYKGKEQKGNERKSTHEVSGCLSVVALANERQVHTHDVKLEGHLKRKSIVEMRRVFGMVSTTCDRRVAALTACVVVTQ
ncbi:hypothetical protein LAB1_56490 [Roseibium sp. LAB1]